MSAYLAEHGGSWSDKAYKHAGALTLTGPFETPEDAWTFADALDDHLLDEYRQVKGFAVLLGQIDGIDGAEDTDPLGRPGGIMTPKERLMEEHTVDLFDWAEDNLRNAVDSKELAQLDRWWPEWERDLREDLRKQEEAFKQYRANRELTQGETR